jgi:hypothetical protein
MTSQEVYTPGGVATAIGIMTANGAPAQVPTWGAVWHESGAVVATISGPTDSQGRKVVSWPIPPNAAPGWYGVGIATWWGEAYTQFYVSPLVAGR